MARPFAYVYHQYLTIEVLTFPLKPGPGLMLGLAVFEEAGDGKAASHGGADYRQAA